MGYKKYETDTALALILDNLNINKEKGNISCVLQTDLSSAYDTIDHQILLKKMEFYGIRDKELKLLTNYLSNRYQFVMVDTFKSKLKKSLDCSVIQGSKLSSILYINYTNEIPMLSNFLC